MIIQDSILCVILILLLNNNNNIVILTVLLRCWKDVLYLLYINRPHLEDSTQLEGLHHEKGTDLL